MDRNFTIAVENNLAIVLVYFDQGRTVTSDADKVIEDLKGMVAGDRGQRRVYYRDTVGRFDELLVSNGQLSGFSPCPQVNDQACQK